MRSIATLLIVMLGSAWALGWATDGYGALTSEQARRHKVAREPLVVPDAQVTLHDGVHASLRSLVANQPKSTLITFVYTRCTTICVALGYEFKRLQDQIVDSGLSESVQLLSISFDPELDTPEVLAQYAGRMRADPVIWRIATIEDKSELEKLLDTFGIIVIRDEFGGFQHNAAFHIIDPDGRLSAIVDLTKPNHALKLAIEKSER